MFIDTLKLIVEIHSFILSAQNGALRLLWVFKRNQGQRHPKKFAYGLYLSDLLPYFHEKASYRPYLR